MKDPNNAQPKEMSPEMEKKLGELTTSIAEIMLMAYQEGIDHGIEAMKGAMEGALERNLTPPHENKDC